MALTLSRCLDEAGQYKAEIVPGIEPVPKRTGPERHQAGSEAWFLASGRDTQVNIIAKPVVGVHVPPAEEGPRVLRRFHHPRVDVLKAIPGHFSRHGVDAIVA